MGLTFVWRLTRIRKSWRLFVFAGALSLIAVPAFAQSNSASLSGTVYDPQHQAIPGASVQLTSDSTHAIRQVTSNEQGIFQITGLLPDLYKVSVQAPGFAVFNQSVRLECGQVTTLDVELSLSSLSTTVRVDTQTATVLRTTDASVGEVVEPTSI